jgi:hypothetical protein
VWFIGKDDISNLGARLEASTRTKAPATAFATSKFLEIMRRANDVALFDEDAKQRVGEAISRSARQRGSELSYSNGPKPRR